MRGIIVNKETRKIEQKFDYSMTQKGWKKKEVLESFPNLNEKKYTVLDEEELDKKIGEIRMPARGSKFEKPEVDENGEIKNFERPPTYHYELEGELLGEKEVDVKGFHRKLSEAEEQELEEATNKKIVEIKKMDERVVEKPIFPNDPESEKDLFRETYTETIDDRRKESREQ